MYCSDASINSGVTVLRVFLASYIVPYLMIYGQIWSNSTHQQPLELAYRSDEHACVGACDSCRSYLSASCSLFIQEHGQH